MEDESKYLYKYNIGIIDMDVWLIIIVGISVLVQACTLPDIHVSSGD